jgi:density-regulated protein DRP1
MPADFGRLIYCGVCSLPPEYCEYMPSHEKCRQWLEEHHPAEYERLYPSNVPEGEASNEGANDRPMVQTASSKRAGKAAVRDESVARERAQAARQHAHVVIRRQDRTKRKAITTIIGLELLGLELRAVAKRLAAKFACGCSVSDITPAHVPLNPKCTSELVLQGDYLSELLAFLPTEYPDNLRAEQIQLLDK